MLGSVWSCRWTQALWALLHRRKARSTVVLVPQPFRIPLTAQLCQRQLTMRWPHSGDETLIQFGLLRAYLHGADGTGLWEIEYFEPFQATVFVTHYDLVVDPAVLAFAFGRLQLGAPLLLSPTRGWIDGHKLDFPLKLVLIEEPER